MDIKWVVRSLGRSRAFSATVIVTLAIGMAVTAGMGTVVRALLHTEPNVSEPARLVVIKPTLDGRILTESALDDEAVAVVVAAAPAGIGPIAGFGFALVSVEAGGRAAVVKGEAVFGPYFDLLGIQPVAGRLLAAADEHEPHLVIGERLWRRWFNGATDTVGRAAVVNGRPFTIVGIVPEGFQGLHGGHVLGNDVWLPRGVMTTLTDSDVSAHTFGRLKLGETRERVDHALRALLVSPGESSRVRGVAAVPFSERFSTSPVAMTSVGVIALLCAALVLLACGGNLVSLFLARTLERQKELSIRLMLGANEGQLRRLLAIEVLILVSAATLVGGLLGTWGTRLLTMVSIPIGTGLAIQVKPLADMYVIAVLAASAAAVALVLIAVVSRRLSHMESIFHHAVNPRRRLFVMSVQTVSSAAILTVAVLLLQGAIEQVSSTMSPEADRTLVGWLDHRVQGTTRDRVPVINAAILEAAGSLPGLDGFAMSSDVPGERRGRPQRVRLDNGREGTGMAFGVSAGFFSAFGYAVQRGQTGVLSATANTVVINDAAATEWFGEAEPVGQRLALMDAGAADAVTVAAVVTRAAGPGGQRPEIYLPLESDRFGGRIAVSVVTRRSTTEVTDELRATVARAGHSVSLHEVRSLRDELSGVSAQTLQIGGSIAALLAAAVCLVTVVGVSGGVAFAAGRRRRDVAIRLALGAPAPAIYTLFGRDYIARLAGSAVVGTLLGLALTRALSPHVSGVPTAGTPVVLVPVLLCVVCGLACILPIRSLLSRLDVSTAFRPD